MYVLSVDLLMLYVIIFGNVIMEVIDDMFIRCFFDFWRRGRKDFVIIIVLYKLMFRVFLKCFLVCYFNGVVMCKILVLLIIVYSIVIEKIENYRGLWKIIILNYEKKK